MTAFKTLCARFGASVFTTTFAITLIAVNVHAAPSTLPILAKRTSSTTATGKVRSTECMIHPDGLVITRNTHGIITTETREFTIQGDVETKIDEAIATKNEEKKSTPLEYSYAFVAFKTSASGIQNTVVLSSYNGTTGEDVFNPSTGAAILRDIMNSVCN